MNKIIQNETGNVVVMNSELVGDEFLNAVATCVQTLGAYSPESWPTQIEFTTDKLVDDRGVVVYGDTDDTSMRISLSKILDDVAEAVKEDSSALCVEGRALFIALEAVAHEAFHICFPEADEGATEENAKTLVNTMFEQYSMPTSVGGWISDRIGEIITSLPDDHRQKQMVSEGYEVLYETGETDTMREYIRKGVENELDTPVHWPEEVTGLMSSLIVDEPTTSKDQKEKNMTEIKPEKTTDKPKVNTDQDRQNSNIILIDNETTEGLGLQDFFEQGWDEDTLVAEGLAQWIKKRAPKPPQKKAPTPPTKKAPAPPSNQAPSYRQVVASGTPVAEGGQPPVKPQSQTGFAPVRFGNTGPVLATGDSKVGSFADRPYDGHNVPDDAVKAIMVALGTALWDHFFINCGYRGYTGNVNDIVPFENPEMIEEPIDLSPLLGIHPNADLVIKEFQIPGQQGGYVDCLQPDGSWVIAGYRSSNNRPVVKIRIDEGSGLITELLFTHQTFVPSSNSPASQANAQDAINGKRMMWCRYEQPAVDERGVALFYVADDGPNGSVKLTWTKINRNIQTGQPRSRYGSTAPARPAAVANRYDHGRWTRQAPAGGYTGRTQVVSPTGQVVGARGSAAQAPRPKPALVMTDKAEYTYEEYVASGWSDKDLVDNGLAQWEAPAAPKAPAPPRFQATAATTGSDNSDSADEEDEFPDFVQG